MNEDFWSYLDRLILEDQLVIDRPKGSAHPHYPELIYPLDYGFINGTIAGDGAGIDIWLGESGEHRLTAVVLTVDLGKRDAEIKLALGCTPDELDIILNFLNGFSMRAIAVRRP